MISCVTIKGSIRNPDAKKTNEAVRVQFFRIGVPKIPYGLSPFSSASLYLRTQTSMPWAMLAKSRLSIFSLRYSTISGGKVTVNDTLCLPMLCIMLQTDLNNCNCNYSNATESVAEGTPNVEKQPTSESYGRIHRARRGKMHLYRYRQPAPCDRNDHRISPGRGPAGDEALRGRGNREDPLGGIGGSHRRMEAIA